VPHHGEAHGDESAALVEETVARQEKDGRRGVVALVTGYLLVTWAGVVAADPAHWAEIDTVFALFLAPDAWLKVFHTAALAAGATGVGMLFFFFAWEGGGKVREREYAELIRRTAYRLTAVAFLAQPVLLVGYLALLPDASLTGALFALAGGAILLILLAAQFVYAFARDPRPGYAAYAFYTLGLAFVLLVVADQTAIGTATRGNATRLAGVHARTTADLKAQLGVGAPAVTGEDIYNGRCSACHLFDAKKVGPPYRETMPKYQGKKDALIAFILNPVKVNPAYPPMPNQGLKPAEAESIATYLLRRTAAVPPPPQSVQGK
jgi:cytochrome c